MAELLILFPELKTQSGPITKRLQSVIDVGADPAVLNTWQKLVEKNIQPENDDDEF